MAKNKRKLDVNLQENWPSYLRWYYGEALRSKKLGKTVRFLGFRDGKVVVGNMVLGELPELLEIDDLSRPEFKLYGRSEEVDEGEVKFAKEAEEVRKMMRGEKQEEEKDKEGSEL